MTARKSLPGRSPHKLIGPTVAASAHNLQTALRLTLANIDVLVQRLPPGSDQSELAALEAWREAVERVTPSNDNPPAPA